MQRDQNALPVRAGQVLTGALLRLANERRDVREALASVHAWLGQELENLDAKRESPQREGELRDRVLAQSEGRRVVDDPGRSTAGLEAIVRRARWKAAACRLASDKRAAEESGDGVTPELRRLEDGLRSRREQLEDCYAWMLDSPRPLPDDDLLLQAAACYDTVGLAAELTLELQREGALDPSPPADLLYLLAESQSALLAALSGFDLRNDSDQRDLFLWLKDQTTRHRIYVDRHMRLDDPADCTASEERGVRLRTLAADIAGRAKARLERDKLISKMRYHVAKMVGAGTAGPGSDWDSLVAAVGAWTERGFSSTDRGLHEALEPLADRLAEGQELPEAVQRVLMTELKPIGQGGSEEGSASSVEEARSLLSGKSVVLFGKAEIGAAGDAIRDELELGDLRFVELEEVGAQARIEPALDDEDVDLVMIAMRLPMDDYTWFKEACMQRDKPFVRLPAGVGPHQVAHQVIRQVGWRLRSKDRSPA